MNCRDKKVTQSERLAPMLKSTKKAWKLIMANAAFTERSEEANMEMLKVATDLARASANRTTRRTESSLTKTSSYLMMTLQTSSFI